MIETFWQLVTTRFLRVVHHRQAHHLPLATDHTRAMLIGERFPGMAGVGALVGDEVPRSERLRPAQLFLRQIALFFKQNMSAWRADPNTPVDDGLFYAQPYRELTGTPWRPEAFEPGCDLIADLLVRGPFSFYGRRRDDGDYEFDLTALESLPIERGYLPAGGRAVVSVQDGVARTLRLEGWAEAHEPGDDGFALAQARFLAGLGSYVTIVDHVAQTHLLVCGNIALSTFEELPIGHPLRILLQPMIVETVRVNNYNVGALVGHQWSATPAYSRYPVQVVHGLIRQAAEQFRFADMDPVLDAAARGLRDLPDCPTVSSACEIFTIMQAFTSDYCAHYLSELDGPTRAWVARLDREIPGGVTDYLGIDSLDALTAEHVARIVAVHAYTASVRHYLVGELTRNYYLYPLHFPPAVPSDGGPPPRGLMLEKANAIAIASIKRFYLLDETTPMPDADGLALRDTYFGSLRAFRARQAELEPELHYRIDPEILMSSIHA